MTNSANTKPLSMKAKRKRRWLFVVISLLFGYLLLEVVLRITTPALMGFRYTLPNMKKDQSSIALTGKGEENAAEVLNPYFGWTFDPNTHPGVDVAGRHFDVNEFGFLDNASPITQHQVQQTTIAILGGSFAQEFGMYSSEVLIQQLKQSPRFHNKAIRIVRLGMAGFKQPQQLMVLNYMFSLGAEYDYVINLDGFNEGVLPLTDNLGDGIHIIQPRGWHARLQDVFDPEQTSSSFQIYSLRAKRQTLAQQIQQSPLRFSYVRQLIWKIRDEWMRNTIVNIGLELYAKTNDSGRQFAVSGPEYDYQSEEEVMVRSSELWRNCSQQMDSLCQGQGSTYLHFLQPNQYVTDSKTFSSDELKKSYVPESHDYHRVAKAVYPLLQQQGQKLKEQGINFVDLTQIYRDETDTIYRDWCCHVNQAGYDVVAVRIALEIAESEDLIIND